MPEMVTINLWSYFDKISLKNQIEERMAELGLGTSIEGLKVGGLELPDGWPVNAGCEVTLSQLVVLAQKLKLKINISRLSLEPMKEFDNG